MNEQFSEDFIFCGAERSVPHHEPERLLAAGHVVYMGKREQSKFPQLILLLSSSLGLSDTTKLQQVLPCLASGLGVVWAVFGRTDTSCGFHFSNQFQTTYDNIGEAVKHESNEHQSCKRQNDTNNNLSYEISLVSSSLVTLYPLSVCAKKSETSAPPTVF